MNITLNAQQRLLVIVLAILTVVALALITFSAVAHVDLFHWFNSVAILPGHN